MKPEEVHIGATVRVCERHRIAERRGMVGRIANQYGQDGYMAVDVRFSGGHRRLFWPEDLEEISSPRPWWRSLLAGANAEKVPRDSINLSAGYVAGADPLFGESLPHCLTAGRDPDPGVYVGQVALYGRF